MSNELHPLARRAGRFLSDESGATSIEYAILAAGLSIAIVTVVSELGSEVNALFTKTKNGFG